ncbi:glycosyltransferase family 39 protein [bacterium]|nr:glycosyltransferase family 39 protein [bacterium]
MILWCLLLLGAVVRCYGFPDIPPGLNQDEASAGYDAWALWNHGVDRHGFSHPVHLVAWGSGQNALYSYLAMPFIALFGLNPLGVRSLSLAFGLFTLVAFHRFSRAVSDDRTSLWATFLLAVNPWHIMVSRWALESNLFPGIFLIAVWLMVSAVERPRLLPASFACFSLSLYAYGPAYLIVPIFLVVATANLRKLGWRVLLGSWAVFAVLGLPIALFVIVNLFQLPSLNLGLFTVPRLSTPPRFVEVTSIFDSTGAVPQLRQNLSRCLQFLWTQSDPRLWNQIPGFGYAYPVHWPFTLLGLALLLRNWRASAPCFLVLAWILAGLALCPCFPVPNINRLNILFLPLILCTAVGLNWLITRTGRFSPALGRVTLAGFLCLYLAFFGRFCQAYFKHFPARIGPLFFEGLGEAIQFAESNAPGPICLTNQINMPYIYVLFYTQADPRLFQSTVTWRRQGGELPAVSFGRYFFGVASGAPHTSYIWHREEFLGSQRPGDRVRTFGNYVVVISQ